MGFFGKFFSGSQPAPQVNARLVPDWQQQFPGVSSVEEFLAHYGTLDAPARLFFLEDCAAAPWEQHLEDPATPQEMMLLGARHFELGWEQRGERLVVDTTGEQLDAFDHHLTRGLELCLQAGRALGGADIVPFLMAQQCAVVLPLEQRLQVAQEWRALDRFQRTGLQTLARQLDERWGGEPDDQLHFAADIAHTAPAGHSGLGAVPEIIMQRWDFLAVIEGRDFDDCDERTVERDEVQEILELAYRKLGTPDPREEVAVLNRFLWCFYYGMEYDNALEVLERLDGRVSESVWTFRDEEEDPLAEFAEAHGIIHDEAD